MINIWDYSEKKTDMKTRTEFYAPKKIASYHVHKCKKFSD
jgi:hypothetical protein